MFHTVYNSFESKPHGRDYLGKHSSDNPYDDYTGSFKDKSFDPDSKIVLGYSKTVEGAIWLEMQWQRVFRVAEDPQFANRAYQTSVGFSFSGEGENNPMYGKTGENNPNFGRKHSEESLQKNREANLGKKRSEETRQKIRESKMGEKNPFFGKKHSEETIQKAREANSGENNPNFGKTGENSPRYGKKHSEESIQKTREANSGENNPNFGKKWWTNASGETVFQVDSPGPEWQNGRVWKEG
jgi:hypothetical protein